MDNLKSDLEYNYNCVFEVLDDNENTYILEDLYKKVKIRYYKKEVSSIDVLYYCNIEDLKEYDGSFYNVFNVLGYLFELNKNEDMTRIFRLSNGEKNEEYEKIENNDENNNYILNL